jgi:hypothetical protein
MTGTSRKGIGKIGAAAIVVLMVAVVVGVGGFFASQGPPEKLSAQQIISSELAASSTSQYSPVSPATESTCTAGATATETIGPSPPPCGCALVDSSPDGSLYASPNPKVGDDVCLEAYFSDSDQAQFSITNSAGSLVFSASCLAGQAPATSGSPANESCLAFWNTSKPDPQGNAIGAGVYHLVATGSSGDESLEANLTIS